MELHRLYLYHKICKSFGKNRKKNDQSLGLQFTTYTQTVQITDPQNSNIPGLWTCLSFHFCMKNKNTIKEVIKLQLERGTLLKGNIFIKQKYRTCQRMVYSVVYVVFCSLKEPSPIFFNFFKLLEILVSQESSYLSHKPCQILQLKY